MKNLITSLGFLCCCYAGNAQVGIGTPTPHSSAQLDITATNKGLLIPRLTQAQVTAIASPATGLLVYQTNGTAGYYYYNGTAWTQLGGVAGWSLTGNAGTTGSNFIGTTDANPLVFKVSSTNAGYISSAGSSGTFWGYSAGLNNTGTYNVAFGYRSMYSNTTGGFNTVGGYDAMYANTAGSFNTGFGYRALYSNTGSNNTAVGMQALQGSTVDYNTAVGALAMRFSTTGAENTAVGYRVLENNSAGGNNTGIGSNVLTVNSSGTQNTSVGSYSMFVSTTGSGNTAVGYQTLSGLTTGNNNTAVGKDASVSSGALSNTTAIGYMATTTADNMVRIGNSSVTSIGGYASWTTLSDVRFKQDLQPQEHGLDFILQLKPITYHLDIAGLNRHLYGKQADSLMSDASFGKGIRTKEQQLYSGFSAQQVEQAAAKVGYNFSGLHKPANDKDHYTLEYATFVVPLVKAVQEQQALIEGQQKMIEEQAKQLAELKKEMELIKSRLR